MAGVARRDRVLFSCCCVVKPCCHTALREEEVKAVLGPVMATPAYVGELQQSSQPQGGGVVTGQAQQTQPPAAPPPTPAQYMAELQSAPPPQAGQSNTTPATPSGQKSAPPAGTAPPQTPTQTQYVTAEIQSSPTQPGSGQGTAQYIVVTVTGHSLSQRLVVQAASPGTKGGTVSAVSVLSVHPVQPQGHSPPEQRSVVQAAPQTAKTGQSAQLSVTNLQQVHLTQESPGSRGVEAGRQRETERERGALQWGSVKQIDSETDGQPPSRSPSPHCSPGYDRNYSSLCPAFHPSLPFSFPFSLPLHFPLSLPLLPPTGTPVTVQPLPQLLLYETAGATALRVQQLQQVPVQHVYSSQVQYVEGGDAGYTTSTIKYHYYGLRIKASSPLLRLMEDQQHLAMRQQPFSQKQSGCLCRCVCSDHSHSCSLSHDESEKRLPKACLVLLCKYEPVLRWSRECDNTLYQGLVEILIPDVLRPIPSALTQAIRNFAKSLESWLTTAMMNIPEEMVRVKVTSASAFAQTLRRYTSLNHLAQAARAVLQNTAQINQMLSDLNRVDFANVQEQASWVCRCEDRVVQRLEQDFKLTLQQQNSLEQWAAWLDGVVAQVLKPYQASPAFPRAAKLFLLKWSFYSSMVIRDLTLRSAASFGSFHLIRLLYDEYMYYLIEHRVAQAKGETPIAVMGEFASLGRSLNTLDPDKEEEEEEEEESDEECSQELSLPSDSSGLPVDSLEPPTKLPRTDPRGLFSTAPPDN
nr:PREDICTED: MHC class II regulatory factor RFX1 [Lepisosteus oculatus]